MRADAAASDLKKRNEKKEPSPKPCSKVLKQKKWQQNSIPT
jgi:hypothetical protein